jgi:hypothetical protein
MKQGFVIAKNKQAKQFFSRLGAYDRPRWTDKIEEATLYHSDAIAQTAVKKLWEHRHWASKIVPLAELDITLEPPLPKDKSVAPPTDDLPPVEGEDTGDEHDEEHDDLPADVGDADESGSETDALGDAVDGDDEAGSADVDATADEHETGDEDSASTSSGGDEDVEAAADQIEDMASVETADDDIPNTEKHCTCNTETDQHEENCEMSMPVVARVGETVTWNDKKGTLIAVGANYAVIRVDGQDMKVARNSLKESVEAFGLGTGERAAHARAGEQQWRAGAGADRPRTGKTYIYTAKGKYGPYADAGEAKKVMIAMGLGLGAKIVTEETKFSMPKRPDNQGNAAPSENRALIPGLVKPKVAEVDFDDPVGTEHKPETDLDYATTLQDGEKVKIPGNVMAALKDSINTFKKAADYNNGRDDAQASFCMTVTNALEELHDHLSNGNVEGIKQAQIKMTSWMNPITTNIPEVVRDFVLRGGRQPSLRDLFDMKKGEAMLAKVRQGLNYPKGK